MHDVRLSVFRNGFRTASAQLHEALHPAAEHCPRLLATVPPPQHRVSLVLHCLTVIVKQMV